MNSLPKPSVRTQPLSSPDTKVATITLSCKSNNNNNNNNNNMHSLHVETKGRIYGSEMGKKTKSFYPHTHGKKAVCFCGNNNNMLYMKKNKKRFPHMGKHCFFFAGAGTMTCLQRG
mmetsp:Transcript_6114/g.9296  ORF Transcript_6114/g.9296 Transcript_6114/m.9296 type:complete len:116 (-) Transcript_6114:122-469(-)